MKIETEFGDHIFLQLAANVLNRDIVIIPIFRDQAHIQAAGFSVISSSTKNNHSPLFLLQFSDVRFSSPHYQSIRPNGDENNLILNYLRENRSLNNSTRSNVIGVPAIQSSTMFEESSFSPNLHSSIAMSSFSHSSVASSPFSESSQNKTKKTGKNKGSSHGGPSAFKPFRAYNSNEHSNNVTNQSNVETTISKEKSKDKSGQTKDSSKDKSDQTKDKSKDKSDQSKNKTKSNRTKEKSKEKSDQSKNKDKSNRIKEKSDQSKNKEKSNLTKEKSDQSKNKEKSNLTKKKSKEISDQSKNKEKSNRTKEKSDQSTNLSKTKSSKRKVNSEENTPPQSKRQRQNHHPSHPDITPLGSSRSSPGHVIPLTKALCRENLPPSDLNKKELCELVKNRKADIASHNERVLSRVEEQTKAILNEQTETIVSCPDCDMTVHRGSLRKICRNSRI